MVIYIDNAGQVANLYMQTQLNARPDERSLFIFTVRGNTVMVKRTYDPYKENFLGFLKDLGFKHKVKKYK